MGGGLGFKLPLGRRQEKLRCIKEGKEKAGWEYFKLFRTYLKKISGSKIPSDKKQAKIQGALNCIAREGGSVRAARGHLRRR